MIPAQGHYEATYTHQVAAGSKTFTSTKRIEAFDDEGRGLVVNERGQLVPATSYNNFRDVQPTGVEVAGVIPGGGWRIELPNDDGEPWVEPVIAWIVNSSGIATPLIQMPDAMVATECSVDDNGRLIPPGEVS